METAGISIALVIHSLDPMANAGRDREIAGISIALVIHSFDPTKDAIFDSAEYKFMNLVVQKCNAVLVFA